MVDEISSLVGLKPTSTVLERDVLVWQYECQKEPATNCYELVSVLMDRFKHIDNLKLLSQRWKLTSTVKVNVDAPDRLPDLSLPAKLIAQLSLAGCDVEFDIDTSAPSLKTTRFNPRKLKL